VKILQNSSEPIYKQIASQYREQILSGKMPPQSFLPSIRELAQELKISVITTMKAYEILAEEGLVTAVQGKGYFVNPQNLELVREQHLRLIERELQNAINSAKVAGISDDELKEMLATLLQTGD
jgi:GntR family transcriptional regulator